MNTKPSAPLAVSAPPVATSSDMQDTARRYFTCNGSLVLGDELLAIDQQHLGAYVRALQSFGIGRAW